MKNRKLAVVAALLLASLTFILTACAAATTTAPAAANPAVRVSTWTNVDRVVAIGDIHGDCNQFIKALRAAKVIDANDNWIGGKTHLVQVGDIFDRGPDSKKAMDLLIKLTPQAAKAGGMVHALLGNHEHMIMKGDCRYTTPAEIESFGGQDAFRKAVGPEGAYGKWLRQHDTVIRINDTLFLHGGLGPEFKDSTLDQINNAVRDTLSGQGSPLGVRALGNNGPLWLRTWASDAGALAADPVLAKFGARHAVIGHTPQNKITVFGAGRVIGIDTGMTAVYHGPASALIIEKGKFQAVYPDQGDTPVDLNVDYKVEKQAEPAQKKAA